MALRNEAELGRRSSFTNVGHAVMEVVTDRLEFRPTRSTPYDMLRPVAGVFETELLRRTERSLSVELDIDGTQTTGFVGVGHGIVGPDGRPRVLHEHEVIVNETGCSALVGVRRVRRRHCWPQRRSGEFLLAITDNMTEGMIATDANGAVTFVNAAAAKVNIDLLGSLSETMFRSLLQMGRPLQTTGPRPRRRVGQRDSRLYVECDDPIVVQRGDRRCPSRRRASLAAEGFKG